MPWTARQQHTAQAVTHGWKPKGKAKGFTRSFASEVIAESKTMPTRPPVTGMTDEKRRKMRKHLHVESNRGC
jgi:hypothetical protein